MTTQQTIKQIRPRPVIIHCETLSDGYTLTTKKYYIMPKISGGWSYIIRNSKRAPYRSDKGKLRGTIKHKQHKPRNDKGKPRGSLYDKIKQRIKDEQKKETTTKDIQDDADSVSDAI